ncbi:MAG: hypothetical protein H0W64_10025 [Gammaproteobacteria bacterium]|nr:hypothetical protein [Gammaproteobacteria bacterium]
MDTRADNRAKVSGLVNDVKLSNDPFRNQQFKDALIDIMMTSAYKTGDGGIKTKFQIMLNKIDPKEFDAAELKYFERALENISVLAPTVVKSEKIQYWNSQITRGELFGEIAKVIANFKKNLKNQQEKDSVNPNPENLSAKTENVNKNMTDAEQLKELVSYFNQDDVKKIVLTNSGNTFDDVPRHLNNAQTAKTSDEMSHPIKNLKYFQSLVEPMRPTQSQATQAANPNPQGKMVNQQQLKEILESNPITTPKLKNNYNEVLNMLKAMPDPATKENIAKLVEEVFFFKVAALLSENKPALDLITNHLVPGLISGDDVIKRFKSETESYADQLRTNIKNGIDPHGDKEYMDLAKNNSNNGNKNFSLFNQAKPSTGQSKSIIGQSRRLSSEENKEELKDNSNRPTKP